MVDATPREWAPEQAQTLKADVRRLFLRQTIPHLAVFIAGWCVLAVVAVFVAAMPTGIAAALTAAGICAVVIGEIGMCDMSLDESLAPWFVGALTGFATAPGVIFKEAIPLRMGLVLLGIFSVILVTGYVKSYRRIVPR